MQKQLYRFFIITFSISISVFFTQTKKKYPRKDTEFFEKKNSATWDGKIPSATLQKSNSPVTPNLYNLVTSNEV